MSKKNIAATALTHVFSVIRTWGEGAFAAKNAAVSSIERSGTTFTATRANGTTFTFDQQDTNTTYSAGSGLNLSNGAFSLDTGSAFLTAHPVGSWYEGPDPSSHGGTWVAYYPMGMPRVWHRTA